MEKSVRVEAVLDGLITLPSLPGTVIKVMQLLDDPDATLQDVGKVVAQDPSLALKALRVVNSAFYSLRDKVTSVERGIVLLGVKTVRNLVLTASVFETLKGGEASVLRHAVACGTAGRILSKTPGAPISDAGEAFMYGLLHDSGKIVLQQSLPKRWDVAAKKIAEGKQQACDIEKKEVGANHAQIGGLLGERWKLQEDLVAAIAGHHDLSLCATPQQRRRAAFVAVCDWVCYQAGFPALIGGLGPDTPGMWEHSGFEQDAMDFAIQELANSQATIDEFVNIAS